MIDVKGFKVLYELPTEHSHSIFFKSFNGEEHCHSATGKYDFDCDKTIP